MRVADTYKNDDEHHPRHYAALVGESAFARKGTSLGAARKILMATEQQLHVLNGGSLSDFRPGLKISFGPMSTGEGIINAIRDKRSADDSGGVEDKRILCIESELGAALRAFQRQGNTLSAILRAAWDGVTLEPLIKNDPVRATDPHVCILAHITHDELRQLLCSADIWNGFVTRFLWVAVRRGKIVAFPEPMREEDVRSIARELALAVRYAQRDGNKGPMRRPRQRQGRGDASEPDRRL